MSSLALNKLVFDPSAPAEGANVGAYITAADGTLITHSGAALDVNIKTSDIAINVELDHTDGDSVLLGDGTNAFTSTNENGDWALDVHISNSTLDVTATALDIRALTNADIVTAEQGTSPWVVSATQLDIDDLSATNDNVAISDGTDTLAINADGSINTKPSGASGAAYGAKSITTTATDIVTTDLTNRFQIVLQNLSKNTDVYVGSNASVTAANGALLAAGSSMVLDLGAGINVHGITSAGTADLRYFEIAA